VVVLGYNFRPNLQIQFGNVTVECTYHDSGALICTSPPSERGPGGCLVDVVDPETGFHSHVPARFVYI